MLRAAGRHSKALLLGLILFPNIRGARNATTKLQPNSISTTFPSSNPGTVDLFSVTEVLKWKLLSTWDKMADKNTNSACVKDVVGVITALKSRQMWALTMLDSFGKPPSGILRGNTWWTGSSSQCASVERLLAKTNNTPSFSGRYCYIKFQPGDEAVKALQVSSAPNFGLAVCVPSTCNQHEIQKVVNTALEEELSESYHHYIRITDVLCLDTLRVPWTEWKIVIRLLFLAVLSMLLIVGTICDIMIKSKKENELMINKKDKGMGNSNAVVKFLGAFSIYSNGRRILKIERTPGVLEAIGAIRVLALLRIITTHTYIISIYLAANPLDIKRLAHGYFSEFLAQVSLPVDVFFLISGLLVSYSCLNECKCTGGKISWLKFYVHRYIRITPLYFFMAWFFYGTVGSYMTSEPLSFKLRSYYTNCEDYLWRNMLYINNFFSSDEMCFAHGWYLSVDMQIFILMPLILIPLAKYQVCLTWSLAAVGIGIASSFTAYQVYAVNSPLTDNFATLLSLGDRYTEVFDAVYAKPYLHFGVYMVGVICGWLLQTSNLQVKLSKFSVAVGWMLCGLILLGVLFVVDIPEPIDIIWRMLYNSVGRIAFAIAIAWIIFACACGYGGFINTFLSHRFWSPLSRLSYSTYICHVAVLAMTVGLTEVPVALSHFNVLHLLVGEIVCMFAAGLVLFLVFEEPVNQLEQLFIFPKKSAPKKIDKVIGVE